MGIKKQRYLIKGMQRVYDNILAWGVSKIALYKINYNFEDLFFIIEIRVHLALKEFLKSFDLITGYFTQQKLINILEVNMRSHLYDVFLPFFCVVYSLLACVFVQLPDLRHPIKITRFDVLIAQNVNAKAKQTSPLFL